MTDDQDNPKPGTSDFKTVKAGCGIRFDPDTLSEEAGFDFSEAANLAENVTETEKDSDKEFARTGK